MMRSLHCGCLLACQMVFIPSQVSSNICFEYIKKSSNSELVFTSRQMPPPLEAWC